MGSHSAGSSGSGDKRLDLPTEAGDSRGLLGNDHRDRPGLISREATGWPGNASSGVPADKMYRPWGLKKNVIMSTKNMQRLIVYVTQNGDCAHSSLNCRPMQFASSPILRNLCPHCVEGESLPARCSQDGEDQVFWLTRSGQCLHLRKSCPAIAKGEELQGRKLCRCCKWA